MINKKALLYPKGKTGRTMSAVPPAFGEIPALKAPGNVGGTPTPTGNDPLGPELGRDFTTALRDLTPTDPSLRLGRRGYCISVTAFHS